MKKINFIFTFFAFTLWIQPFAKAESILCPQDIKLWEASIYIQDYAGTPLEVFKDEFKHLDAYLTTNPSLVNCVDKDGNTLLIQTLDTMKNHELHYALAAYLIEKGGDVNQTGPSFDLTAIDYVTTWYTWAYGDVSTILRTNDYSWNKSQYEKLITLLLSKGADPFRLTRHGVSAYQRAKEAKVFELASEFEKHLSTTATANSAH